MSHADAIVLLHPPRSEAAQLAFLSAAQPAHGPVPGAANAPWAAARPITLGDLRGKLRTSDARKKASEAALQPPAFILLAANSEQNALAISDDRRFFVIRGGDGGAGRDWLARFRTKRCSPAREPARVGP